MAASTQQDLGHIEQAINHLEQALPQVIGVSTHNEGIENVINAANAMNTSLMGVLVCISIFRILL